MRAAEEFQPFLAYSFRLNLPYITNQASNFSANVHPSRYQVGPRPGPLLPYPRPS